MDFCEMVQKDWELHLKSSKNGYSVPGIPLHKLFQTGSGCPTKF